MATDLEKMCVRAAEENTRLKDTIKRLEDDNKQLKGKIKLLEIYRSNNERLIDLLKRHKDEQQAVARDIIDPTQFGPPNIAERCAQGDEEDIEAIE
ncbi:hypothetical protein DCAR_0311689 [Daucus carota subsp. sativus]|uniref:Uncharacterized protein n=1 Tax=Daucus carota subsp. sativus TaxID=79200 RepID=A0A166AN02_DAUCS|nr:hypothetical protein DCAR_0311689 [Daucus carota subsp. sativus]